MVEKRPEPDAQVSLANLGTAIRWLLERGVSSSRLGAALGTNTGYIRVLRHRARPLHFNSPANSLDALLNRPAASLKERLRVRLHEDAVVHSRQAGRRIDDLEFQIEQVREAFGLAGNFSAGLEELRSYDSTYGYPASARWLRFMARLHQHRAWFYTHSGMSTSAFQEAKIAIDLSQVAFGESDDPLDLRRLTEACLIASNACLLGGDPRTSLKLLDLGAAASERISDPLGSEHYRQRGVGHLQLLGPEDAGETRRYFERAMEAMQRKQECRNLGQSRMVGERHIALMGGADMDRACSILEQVERDFAPSSLENVMMLNWTAACALETDSRRMHDYANGLLRESIGRCGPYGHQATRARLLALTTEVGLARKYWRPWIYRALYENAFRTN